MTKTHIVKGRSGASLSAFVIACLEPLSDELLVDFDLNRLLRQQREGAWRKADCTTRLAQATLDYHRALAAFKCWVEGKDDYVKHREADFQRVTLLRNAVADQILTPAPDRAAVTWKRVAQKDRYLPLAAEDIARAIDADEKFVAAHPVSSRKPGPRGRRVPS